MDDTQETVAPADEKDTRKEVEYSDDDPNLALTFPKEELEKIARKVLDDFDKAYESTYRYRKQCAKNWAIFAGELPEKTFPYAEACNAHVPFMLETLTRLEARLAGEIFGNWEGPLHFMSTTDATDSQADIVEAHTGWQFREDIPDFRRQMKRALLLFVNHGDVTVQSSYDFAEKRNKHETLTVDEFVVPYTMTTTMPDWSDVPFKVRILRPYKHELEAMEGEWNGVTEVLDNEAKWDDEPEEEVADAAAKAMGVEKDDDAPAPYKTLHYEGWMMLPGQTRHRYVKVIVHKASKTVFHLSIHEMPDWKDKARYDKQMADKDQYHALTAAHQSMLEQNDQAIGQLQSQAEMMTHDPMMAEQMHAQLAHHLMASDQLQAAAPVRPQWMADDTSEPEEPRMVPIQLFSHEVCIEPMIGNLGLGYGRVLADYNRAANTALSQYIDAATLQNCWGLITSDIVKFKEQFMVKPGHINKVTGLSMQQVKDNIMELKGGDPSPGLLTLVQMFGTYAQEVAQAPDVLSGDPGKSGETYRGIQTRIDQAVKQLSSIAQGFGQLLKQVGKSNCLLNSMFLPDEQMFPFVDRNTKAVSMKPVSRSMYEQSYTIELRSDLQFSSRQQKVQEAGELLGMLKDLPPLQQNPAFVYQVIAKALQARDMAEMIPFLGPAPQPPLAFMPPPPPPGDPGATGKPDAASVNGGLPKPPQLPSPTKDNQPVPGPGGALPERPS